MRTVDVEILMVPGWTNSGPDHWQSRWQARLKSARRVEQDNWHRPNRIAWTERLIENVRDARKPVVLVAHSCGVATVAHAARQLRSSRVVGAFLVAPASEQMVGSIPGIDPNFVPFPRDPFSFPSLLIASGSDPHCSYDDAGELALARGASLVDAGEVGQINAESGHGPWPEGAMRLGWFLKKLG
jgi:predicted alpha/beta hydrolase family esterase